jgi:hypothetical protein
MKIDPDNSVGQFNLYETASQAREDDGRLWRSEKGDRITEVALGYLSKLDENFAKIEDAVASLPDELFEEMKESIRVPQLLTAKYAIYAKCQELKSPEELIDFARKVDETCSQIHRDLVSISGTDEKLRLELSDQDKTSTLARVTICFNQIVKNVSLKDQPYHSYATDSKRLTPAVKNQVLSKLQSARVKLLDIRTYQNPNQEEVALSSGELVGLMKRVGDLEDRLQTTNTPPVPQFKEVIFGARGIQLHPAQLEKMEGLSSGKSASYFVKDENENRAAVFKPSNEDASLKPAVPKGESLMRQSAAYHLDKMNGGKAGVALTLKANSEESGLGAIQVFKESHGSLNDLSRVKEAIPVRSLHYLTIHRTRMFDLDAHQGNVLWKRNNEGEIELISIDHDYCFPEFRTMADVEDRENHLRMEWDDFPQMDVPFDEETQTYIQGIDVEKEASHLKEQGFAIESINLVKTMTWLYKEAAEKLTPGQIHSYLISAESDSELLRKMVNVQIELAGKYSEPRGADWENYSQAFETEMKSFIQAKVSLLSK